MNNLNTMQGSEFTNTLNICVFEMQYGYANEYVIRLIPRESVFEIRAVKQVSLAPWLIN